MDSRTKPARQRWRTPAAPVDDARLNDPKAHPGDGRGGDADCPACSLMELVLAFMDRYEERRDCFRA
jgi:hypothetical protein